MKKYLPNLFGALILTPGIFLLGIWVMVLSSSNVLETIGVVRLTFWALLMSFGAAYSITLFVRRMLKHGA